jgi:hypothetical protein
MTGQFTKSQRTKSPLSIAPEGLGRGYHEEIVRVLSRQEAVKIFCDRNANVTKVPYREHVIFWG